MPDATKPGTLTFLMTDLVGSTEQLERLGDETATALTTATIRRLKEVALAHGGDVHKNMGDGILVVFGSALDAVRCAVAMQQTLRSNQLAQPNPEQLPVRIALHAGEPIRVEGEYLGMPINVLVRMSGVAQGGEIIVSEVVRGLTGGRGGFAFRDLGEQSFRSLRAPVRIWEVLWNPDAPRGASETLPAGLERDAQRTAAEREPDTVVILFADIVDSMPHTERLGDAAFRQRARELDGLLRSHVRAHRGTPVDGKLVGDGVLAIFPSARNAIACAVQCQALSAAVELDLHLGIHAGDVIREGTNIYGGAVNIASRISGATGANEILLSDTVRGLARTSGGVMFEDRGEYVLKGIEEPMRLFTVRA
jgi:class 3 adenylate cyclase